MGFLSGGSDSSEKVVKMQEDEAAEARRKADERTARINKELAQIKSMFEGSPVMGSRSVATPASTSYAATPASTRRVQYNDPRTGVNRYRTETVPGSKRAINTPAGMKTVQYDTGKRVDPFANFYNDFRDAITGYYEPDVAEQYGDARDELTYRLARAGTLRSSGAIDEQADLARQNVKNLADVRREADKQVGGMKDRVASEKAKALAQVYAAEDPGVATDAATSAVENISAVKPTLSPLGAIFDIATIGGAGAASGYQNAEYMKNYGLKGRTKDASSIVGRG